MLAENGPVGKSTSRPVSPLRAARYGASPMESARKDYFSYPSSGGNNSARGTPNEQATGVKGGSHMKRNPSMDGLTMGPLPKSPVIRVIYTGGQTKVLNIKHCKTPDEVILCVLKKLQLPEHQYRNYCFYVLDGLDPEPSNCRRLSDAELMQVCEAYHRLERGRLILRMTHAGKPDLDELRRASQLAMDESQITHSNALHSSNARNQMKIQQLTGEDWQNIARPRSRSPGTARNTRFSNLDRTPSSKLQSFFGARPPSEMIIHEITNYFPSHRQKDIEKTMRMSVRRSQRLSRAASR